MEKRTIAFTCDGKCRICPSPGALCKENITVSPETPAHDDTVAEKHTSWMSEELQKEILKKLGL